MAGISDRAPRSRLLAAAGLAAIALAGCTTPGKPGSGAEPTVKEISSKGRMAKGSETASSSYTDPAVVSASSAAYASDGMVADGAPAAASSPTDAMAAGVVTQPTGIRAGSASIFSGNVPVATPSTPDAPMPAMSSGRINARTGSVFSTQSPYPGESCGTDIDGNQISC